MVRIFVIGGGISGLATAFRIRQRFEVRGEPLELHVLEAEERVGGKIRSEMDNGYLTEWGPNGFLDSKPDTLLLCKDLGIEQDLLPSSDQARKRYVFSGGRLHRVPESPGPFLRSKLLTLRGRLRIAKENWAPVTPPGMDTSIAEFGRRRLGQEAVEKILDPMVSGIFAGDPATLSLESCFPRILELERQYGSLLRAMVSLEKEKRKQNRNKPETGSEQTGKGPAGQRVQAGPAGPGGVLTSFRNGMEQLVQTLNKHLGEAVQTRSVVNALIPDKRYGETPGFRIQYQQQGVDREAQADSVVLAVPAHEAARILEGVDAPVSSLLKQTPYAPLVVMGLGYPEAEAPGRLDGFGFVVPYAENTPVLGSLWTSSIFPERAPSGHVLTRNMVGGSRNPWIVSCEQGQLEDRVSKVLEKALGRKGRIVYRKIIRHERAIPQYVLGHGERMKKVEERLGRFPHLHLTGNAFRGVSLNDCTREALRIARNLEDRLLGGDGSGG